jgi:hypothetical protein
MPSDPKRVQQALQHIQRIKAGDYPAIVGRDEQYRIVERPFKELAEPSKLAILQDAVDWSGVTNRDRAHILLAQVDPGRITDSQRRSLIDMSVDEMIERASGRGSGRDRSPSR